MCRTPRLHQPLAPTSQAWLEEYQLGLRGPDFQWAVFSTLSNPIVLLKSHSQGWAGLVGKLCFTCIHATMLYLQLRRTSCYAKHRTRLVMIARALALGEDRAACMAGQQCIMIQSAALQVLESKNNAHFAVSGCLWYYGSGEDVICPLLQPGSPLGWTRMAIWTIFFKVGALKLHGGGGACVRNHWCMLNLYSCAGWH